MLGPSIAVDLALGSNSISTLLYDWFLLSIIFGLCASILNFIRHLDGRLLSLVLVVINPLFSFGICLLEHVSINQRLQQFLLAIFDNPKDSHRSVTHVFMSMPVLHLQFFLATLESSFSCFRCSSSSRISFCIRKRSASNRLFLQGFCNIPFYRIVVI